MIVTKLTETDEPESQEVADRLRILLSEWLTVPVPFEGTLLESLAALGQPGTVEARWGGEVRGAYDAACAAARTLQGAENPVRTEVREVVTRLRAQGASWRIYCHRRARAHFDSCFGDAPLPSSSFLHSAKDYREAEPFDVLVKVGPLRSRGWGAAPDAVISAPRFGTLIQIVWPGCDDEADFGYDPVAPPVGTDRTRVDGGSRAGVASRAISWTRRITPQGDTSTDISPIADVDELTFFQALARTSDVRRAILVQIDEEDGILYPPHSQVPTFDPQASDEDALGHRLPGQTVGEGMYLIWPLLGTTDLGPLQAGEGHYSRIWKERLRDEFRRSPEALTRHLRAAGLELRNLRSCIRQWCRPASSVIHAPQQRRHFEILIRVLGIEHDTSSTSTSRSLKHAWWQYAWSEIGRTRGEAIQTGLQEHEIIDEQLFDVLSRLIPEIRQNVSTEVFDIALPAEGPLSGTARFYKVRAVEEGFLAPDNLLKVVCDLDTVEQWRA